MSDQTPSRAEIEAAMRALLTDNDLPEPDEVLPHENGGIVCLWHEQRIAIVVDPDEDPVAGPGAPPILQPESPHLH
jgi:hypothetical protein